MSLLSSLWLLVFSHARIPIREFADFVACPFRREYQYDMGEISAHFFNRFGGPSAPNVKATLMNRGLEFLDVGSGNGTASVRFIRHFAGIATKILLSDRVP